MKLRCFLFVLWPVAGLLRTAAFEDRVEALYRAPLGEMMALSPDGQRVAYTQPTDRELAIIMADIDPPGAEQKIAVKSDRDAAGAMEQLPIHLRFLHWATNTRLVFAPVERVIPLPPVADKNGRPAPNPDGPAIVAPIMAVDADGNRQGTLIDAHNFQETPAEARRSLADLLRIPQELSAAHHEVVRWRMPHVDILGFLANDREQLIIGTHGAYSIPMQYLVDIRTAQLREFGGDAPVPPGDPKVFDWYRNKVVGERQEAARPAIAWDDAELGKIQLELARKFPRRVVEILDWNEARARVLFRVTGGSDAGRVFVYQRTEDLALEILHVAPWLDDEQLNETRAFEFAAPDGAVLGGYVTWPREPRVSPPPLLVVFAAAGPDRALPAFDPQSQILADLGFAVVRLHHRTGAGARTGDRGALRAAVDRVSADQALVAIEWLAAHHRERPFDRTRVAALVLSADALRARLQRLGRPPESVAFEQDSAAAPPASRAAAYRRIGEFLQAQLSDSAVSVALKKEAP